jgi:hypothetical protein
LEILGGVQYAYMGAIVVYILTKIDSALAAAILNPWTACHRDLVLRVSIVK